METEKKRIQESRGSQSLIYDDSEKIIEADTVSRAVLKKIVEDSIIPADSLARMEIKDDFFIMKPWLRPGTLAVVHGSAGVGKTFFCLCIAAAITRKVPIGRWEVERPVGCLYVDGEMALGDLQADLQTITANLPPGKAPLDFLTSEIMEKKFNVITDIQNEKWRGAITDTLKSNPDIGLLILDNLSSLAPNLNEISKQARAGINSWQLELRRMKKSVIVVHHANKKGDLRGSSSIIDSPNYAIGLKDLNRGSEDHGAYFSVQFTKKRRIRRQDAEPFSLMINQDLDSGYPWTASASIGQKRGPYIIGLIGLKMKQRDIAEALSCTEANVSQIKKKATRDGFFNQAGDPTEKWFEIYKGDTAAEMIAECNARDLFQ
jgi:hypothetical protein